MNDDIIHALKLLEEENLKRAYADLDLAFAEILAPGKNQSDGSEKRGKNMTEQEKTAMKAVLYLAQKNPQLRYGGTWVEDAYNMETCARISFRKAIDIVDRMLYGPVKEAGE